MKKFAKKCGVLFSVLLVMTMFMAPMSVSADGPGSVVNDVLSKNTIGTQEGAKGDIFAEVNNLAQGAGESLKKVVTTVGVFVLIISLGICALGFTKKGANDREMNKQRLVYIIVAAVIFFGGMSLLLFAEKIAAAIGGAL